MRRKSNERTEPSIEVSVVLPAHNGAQTLRELCARIRCTLSEVSHEILVIDDGSSDDTSAVLEHCAGPVRSWRHERNLGQMEAIRSGLARARGAWIIVMDADLQDPPEVIPALLAERSGAELVLATCHEKAQASWREMASRLLMHGFYRAFPECAGPRPCTFSLLSGSIRASYLASPYAGWIYVHALRILATPRYVRYKRQPRVRGRSSYSLWRLLRLTWKLWCFGFHQRGWRHQRRAAASTRSASRNT